MRIILLLVLLSPIHAWNRLQPPDSDHLRQICGNRFPTTVDGKGIEWAVRVRNDDAQLDCGGAFITPKHVLTSPSCLFTKGKVITDLSQITVHYKNSAETPAHYRFPSVFLNRNFRGAEIAVLEMADGLVGHSPVCLPDLDHQLIIGEALWMVTNHDTQEAVKVAQEMTDCLNPASKKGSSPPKSYEHCLFVFSATTGSDDLAKGDPIYKLSGTRQYLVGMTRDVKNLTVETLDFEGKSGYLLAISLFSWSQFICEHTGLCHENTQEGPDLFRGYIEDGVAVAAKHPDCRTTSLERITARFATMPRISRTEAEKIRRNCGRGKTVNGVHRKHAYFARIFLGSSCQNSDCGKVAIDASKKICDGVFISNVHILASNNCFRTVNLKETSFVVLGVSSNDYKVYHAVGPEYLFSTANDFVILNVAPPAKDDTREVVCLPTKEMAKGIETKDTKLTIVDFHEDGPILKEEVDAKLKRISCSDNSKQCSYLDVETTKGRAELFDGTPFVFSQNSGETEQVYLAGLLVGRANETDNSKRVTDTLHMLERICVLTGVCMERFDTLKEIAVTEQFRDDFWKKASLKGLIAPLGFEFYETNDARTDNKQLSSNEWWAELNVQRVVYTPPQIHRITKQENEELQHTCGKGSPKPMINFGTNMTTSQFVVGIGVFLNYPMDFSNGPWCTGAIISSRHVMTAAHCVDLIRHDPSRLYIMYGSNCFNAVFSRNDHTSYHTKNHVPCPNNQQKIALVKHIITQKSQLYQSKAKKPTQFQEKQGQQFMSQRTLGVGDFAILELREDVLFDGHTSPICMPQQAQEYSTEEPLSIYGVGGATRQFPPPEGERHRYATGHAEFSLEGMVTRATFTASDRVRIGKDEDYWVEEDDFEEGMQGSDPGDSGGPWTKKSREERMMLVAVSSRGWNMYTAPWNPYNTLPIKSATIVGAALEHDSDFICKWTGVCPQGIDASRDKQETNVNGVQYCGELPPAI